MHDRYDGKFLKTMSFLQNNTAYTTGGQEQKSQWYEHIEIPGKLRIAFLPATQRSGLVQVDDRVATFDNGIRVDFRPSVNPLLLLTADVYAAPVTAIMRGLDSLNVDGEIVRTDEWDGQPVYVVGAKAGDSTSNQLWVDRNHLRLVRFIQRNKAGERTMVSDIRVQNYKDIQGFEVPTEFLVLRNGRPVWREQYADVRVNEDFPTGTFDQAKWYDIPIPN
jgi:sulfur carrier protein ThiS